MLDGIVADVKEEKSIISLSKSPRTYTLLSDHCAIRFTIYFATEVVIFTDEPALVAEPGWLQSHG